MYNEYAHESFEAEQFEYAQHEGVFSAEQEMEMAYELLEVNSEAELNHFLGNFIRTAGSAIGQAVSSPQGQAIGGALKTAARNALTSGGKAGGESLGGAAGSWGGEKLGAWAGNKLGGLVGAQGWGDKGRQLGGQWGKSLGTSLGGKIGGSLGNYAANALGFEAETMQQEEFELAGAQHFIRMAGEIANQTLNAPPHVNPRAAAHAASLAVARQLAPGLFAPQREYGGYGSYGGYGRGYASQSQGQGQSGRWVRRGGRITLYGV